MPSEDKEMMILTLGDRVEKAIPLIKEQLLAGYDQEAEFRKAANLQRQENLKMERALRIFDPTYEPTVKAPKKNGSPKVLKLSVDRLRPIAEMAIELAEKDEDITQIQLRETGMGRTAISAAVAKLLQIGMLRKAGQDGTVKLYRLMDAKAWDKYVEEEMVSHA